MLRKLTFFVIIGFLGINPHLTHSQLLPEKATQSETTFDKTNRHVEHDLFLVHVIPKCGTHFFKRTLNLMIGKKFFDRLIRLKNLKEAQKNNFILKTFEPYDPKAVSIINQCGHKLISVIRDPRDALISHVFYMRTFSEGPSPKTQRDFFQVGENFDVLSLDEQITSLINGDNGCMSYVKFYKARLGWAFDPNNLTIKYEELLGANGGGDNEIQKNIIEKIADFISLELTSNQINEVVNNMYQDFGQNRLDDGRIFERSTTGNWKNFLSAHHKQLIKTELGKEIIELGYANDDNW